MNLSLRQLQILVHVHRAGNLTRAATQLGLTQAAVSLQLQQLEKAFGLRLFDRTTRELVPTGAGVQATAAAEQILAATDNLTNQMRNLNGVNTGKLAMAVSAGFASTFMPPILCQFRKDHPGVDIVLYDVSASQLVDKLLTTDAEFAIGSVQGPIPDVTIERILKGRISAIGVAKGSFGTKKQISWNDLPSFATICMRQDNMVRADIDTALAKSSKRFDPTFEVSLFNTAMSMTASGIGLTILPDYLLVRQQFPTLTAKPLVGPAIEYQMSLIRKVGRTLSPAAAKFVGLVRAQLGRISGSKRLIDDA
ncbi:LysR family transcriptional regulator [Bradyrhizobium sp. LHD-71]|uniref:LysR family transcriptional regulator n=1 Tax=Bradyrhizobium sp. LHD-71 TaxID=3072141 RepID=UPI00281074C2|nr:LysR family transcriptional regulator [Bradyrhizobium sp. LHD-71]MDQ8728065.1 LysR family transcriptional regulator [Bradyrhizobium sp. LHD-71]